MVHPPNVKFTTWEFLHTIQTCTYMDECPHSLSPFLHSNFTYKLHSFFKFSLYTWANRTTLLVCMTFIYNGHFQFLTGCLFGISVKPVDAPNVENEFTLLCASHWWWQQVFLKTDWYVPLKFLGANTWIYLLCQASFQFIWCTLIWIMPECKGEDHC